MADLDITIAMKIDSIGSGNAASVQVGLVETAPAAGMPASQMTLYVPKATPDLDYGQICTVRVKSASGT